MRKLLVLLSVVVASLAGSAIAPAPANATTCESDPEAVCTVFLTGMSVVCKYTAKHAGCFQ